MLYFRYGEEDFQIQRDCQQQLNKILTESPNSSNYSFNALELDWPDLSNIINNQSLFQANKVIIINNLLSAKKQTLENGLLKELNEGNLAKQPSLQLLLNEPNLKMKYRAGQTQPILVGIDGRTKPLTKNQQLLFTLLNKTAEQSIYYQKLNGLAAEQFLDQLISEKGGQLTRAAKKTLLELSNYNFWQIYHELNKLINYQASFNQPTAIDETTVSLLINDTSGYIFELIEAISNQKLATAAGLMEKIFNNDESLAISIALLNRQTLQFLEIKAKVEAGQSMLEIERSLGLPKTIAQKLINQALLLKSEKLTQLINNLTRLDWSNKNSRGGSAPLLVLLTIAHAN